MILFILLEALLKVLTGVEVILLSVLNSVTNIAIDLPLAVASVFLTMIKVSMYLFAIAPLTFQTIYSWIYTYFLIWLAYHSISLVKSLIPHRHVVR